MPTQNPGGNARSRRRVNRTHWCKPVGANVAGRLRAVVWRPRARTSAANRRRGYFNGLGAFALTPVFSWHTAQVATNSP